MQLQVTLARICRFLGGRTDIMRGPLIIEKLGLRGPELSSLRLGDLGLWGEPVKTMGDL